LGARKGIRPLKKSAVGCWRGYTQVCLERGADLHMAQLMPLPLTFSCFCKIQTGFTFLVPAHPGSPGKWAAKLVCVCVFICILLFKSIARRHHLQGIRCGLLSLLQLGPSLLITTICPAKWLPVGVPVVTCTWVGLRNHIVGMGLDSPLGWGHF